ncbi:MAG: alcohol dehydrogenase catalytic domain-containing protein [Acidimicrobiia bacterium]|nr:alcohol dehydrogenase catalytic domain-containing protein [Acidimicrobiia bacterium]
MRAVVYYGPSDIRVENVDEPGGPGPGEVLVRPLWCGICGTDLHEYTSGPIVTPVEPHPLTGVTNPQILGHEFSAEVVEIGTDVESVRPGDRVSVMPLIFCGKCDMCRRGQHHMCRIMACTGLSSSSGGLAELAIVQEYQVAPIPDAVTDIQAAAVEPAAVALYGVERARFPAGGRVLIAGSGPIGALAALAASALGAGEVIISEPNPNRAAFAADLNVGPVITDTGDAMQEHIQELTGGQGVDAAIECAGKEAAFNACIDAVRPQGSVVQTGLHVAPAMTVPETWSLKDLTIEGTWCYNVTDWPRVIRLIASGKYPVDKIITSRLGVDSIVADGFDRLIDPAGDEVKVLGSATQA